MRIGVPAETRPGETRVAATPETVKKLAATADDAAFEKQTGHRAAITFNTTPQMLKRIGGGDTFDVVIAPPGAVKEFAAGGKVEQAGFNVGRIGSGVTLRPGAPVDFVGRHHPTHA
jgi:hypothetical protein